MSVKFFMPIYLYVAGKSNYYFSVEIFLSLGVCWVDFMENIHFSRAILTSFLNFLPFIYFHYPTYNI
jgi:hypothetical protein